MGLTEIKLGGESGVGGGRNDVIDPSFERSLTATPASSGIRVLRAVFVTSHARPDGADIRVYDVEGKVIPAYVYGIQNDPGGLKYGVSWQAALTAGTEARFTVRYGDLGATGQLLSGQDAAQLLYAARNGFLFKGQLLSTGPGIAYLPTDFETAGSQIFGNRDDLMEARPTPTPLSFAGNEYSQLYHGSNGWIVFSSDGAGLVVAGSNTGINPGGNAFALAWGNGDLYEVWRREVVLDDGYAWHIRAGLSGYGGGIDLTVRYQHMGIWTLTMFHNEVDSMSLVAQALVGIGVEGEKRIFTGSGVRRDEPSTALAIRYGPILETVNVGAEVAL